jgi:hypothetical protein
MAVDYITIPLSVLQAPNLCDKQKMLLGLVIRFNSKGFMMSNEDIGKLLMIIPTYASELISDLKTKGYIRITGEQSRWRKIYFRENPKVVLSGKTESKSNLLSGKTGYTFGKNRNISKVNNTTAQWFNTLWEAYPKKKKRKYAEIAFRKINPDRELFDVMLKALARQKQTEDWQKENGRFIPNLEKWLDGEYWQDVLPENSTNTDARNYKQEILDAENNTKTADSNAEAAVTG